MKTLIKEFFSWKHFEKLKLLLILEILIVILSILLANRLNISLNYFNIFALLFSLFVYCLSVFSDPEKYFNLATFICVEIFSYGCFWILFNCLGN